MMERGLRVSGARNKKQKVRKLLIFWSFLITIGLIQPINFAHAPASLPSTPLTFQSFREPFKDFFDYEWWLPGSEYYGLGRQYGKWKVIEMFPDNAHDFRISSDNPISGTDSAVLDINGSRQGPLCETWLALGESPDPDSSYFAYPDMFMSPCYMRFRFRIDEWNATNSYWRVTLGELSGNENSVLITQVIVALEGFALPHLWMLYKTGSNSTEWIKHELVSSTTVSLGDVHTIELYRYAHPTDGEVKVWFDGNEVSDLTVQKVDTSYPGGVRGVRIGSNAYYTKLSPGSWATITFDDLRVRDQYVGTDPISMTYYNLTLDSSPQGKTVRVGNWMVGQTPMTLKVPEGTVPKIGVDPIGFDHWEIIGSPDYSSDVKDKMSTNSEIWPTLQPTLIATRTHGDRPSPQEAPPRIMPAIYQDTKITAIYATATHHTLTVDSDPVATSFSVDGLQFTTSWSDSLTEGTHTIVMPSTFAVGEKRYDFRKWEDGSTNPTRTMNLVGDKHITAYYDETIIPEFPTLIALLAVVGVATLVIVLGARRMRIHSRTHRHFSW